MKTRKAMEDVFDALAKRPYDGNRGAEVRLTVEVENDEPFLAASLLLNGEPIAGVSSDRDDVRALIKLVRGMVVDDPRMKGAS